MYPYDITFQTSIFEIFGPKYEVQWCALENQQSPFYVVNTVTLTGKNLHKNPDSPLNWQYVCLDLSKEVRGSL